MSEFGVGLAMVAGAAWSWLCYWVGRSDGYTDGFVDGGNSEADNT